MGQHETNNKHTHLYNKEDHQNLEKQPMEWEEYWYPKNINILHNSISKKQTI